jgi:hypothetical protein
MATILQIAVERKSKFEFHLVQYCIYRMFHLNFTSGIHHEWA